MTRWLTLLLALSGCGRVNFDPLGGDAQACDPTAPFGAPVLIPELADPTFDESSLRLLPDELSGYYWRGNVGARDIYLATRPTPTEPFTLSVVPGLDSATDELDPAPSSDGTFMVLRLELNPSDLFIATRNAPDSFTTPTALTTVNIAANHDRQPFLPIGRDELFFSSTRSGFGDIYVSTRNGTSFSAPTLVGELASTMDDGDPIVTPDGLTIYFRSNRPSVLDNYNIFRATRSTPTEAFGAATYIDNINTPANDNPSWISPDDCRLYMSSDIAGTFDVYVATRGM